MDTDTRIAALEARIEALEAQLEAKSKGRSERDYGPKSKKRMTHWSALAVAMRLKQGEKVKDIANRYGFSRGQVYSLRGGYTYTNETDAVGYKIIRK